MTTAKKTTAKKPTARKRPTKRVECARPCREHANAVCDMEKGHGGMHSHVKGQGFGQVFHLYRTVS